MKALSGRDGDVLARAERLRSAAASVVRHLGLMERLAELGRPVPVGAMAYDVMTRPDIDIEVYSASPGILASFAVMARIAEIPGVRRIRFANALDEPDQGLYWGIRYRAPDADAPMEWSVDIWLLPDDHPGPKASDLVAPMQAAMTPEIRLAIVCLKAQLADRTDVHGIDIYRAVIDGHVRSVDAFDRWFEVHRQPELTFWRPSLPGQS